jgi:hypothetical protein
MAADNPLEFIRRHVRKIIWGYRLSMRLDGRFMSRICRKNMPARQGDPFRIGAGFNETQAEAISDAFRGSLGEQHCGAVLNSA